MDSHNDFGGLVRQNWALLVAVCVLVAGAGVLFMRGGSQSASTQADAAVIVPGQVLITKPGARVAAVRKTPQELAVEQIEEHQAKVQADPEHEDSPAYLAAMGNLYRQKLVDYEKAAECYEKLLEDYPDWEGVRVVYMQLATCYERLENRPRALRVYEEMMEVFPADSQEHIIARDAVFNAPNSTD